MGVALSADGRFLATGQTNGTVLVWNRQQRAITGRFTAGTGPVIPLRWLGHAGRLLTLDAKEAVREWDAAERREVRFWASKDGFRAAEISRGGNLMVWLDYAEGVNVRDLETGREVRTRLDHTRIADLAVSSDGGLFATASEEGTVKLWRTATFQEVGLLRGHLLGVHSVAFSPDGTRIATGSNGREAVKLWDPESGQEVLTLEGSSSIFRMTAFSPDGTWLGSVNWTGQLHLWRAPPRAGDE
jgi:WD40 repeat protein